MNHLPSNSERIFELGFCTSVQIAFNQIICNNFLLSLKETNCGGKNCLKSNLTGKQNSLKSKTTSRLFNHLQKQKSFLFIAKSLTWILSVIKEFKISSSKAIKVLKKMFSIQINLHGEKSRVAFSKPIPMLLIQFPTVLT